VVLRGLSLGRYRTEMVLFATFFLIYAATAGRTNLCFDVWTSNYASWQLATHHTPYIDGVSIPELDHNAFRWVWIQDAPNGHTVITRAPAAVIAGIPAYLVSRSGSMTVWPAAMTAALLTTLSVVLMYRAVRSAAEPWQAQAAAVAFGLTTPVWSVAANGIWPQTITVLGIAVAAWAASTERWWWVGVGGVLMLWARPHAAFIVAIVAVLLAWRARRLGIVVRAGLPGVVSLPLLCLWTHWIYGSWSPMPLFGSGAFSMVKQSLFDPVNQAAMFVATDRGLFVYTPVLLVLLPTVVRRWRELPEWSTALLVAGLGYTILQSALISFLGGWPLYGYRYGLELLACAAPAYAFAACRATGWARRALAPVLAVQFTVILLGAVFDRAPLWDTDGWSDNAFFHAMYHGAPAAPIMAVLVTGTTLAVIRRWASSRTSAATPLADAPVDVAVGA
jgi:hypothetical protein